jgi:hypothetical protein
VVFDKRNKDQLIIGVLLLIIIIINFITIKVGLKAVKPNRSLLLLSLYIKRLYIKKI